MGWTVLYIAFGAVAVWLLAEVLLQYKARLRWRLLAFAGFATVVLGVVALSSVIVITLGAMAFAVGQTFVTLSYRRGFSTGWALGGMPGSSRRRREGNDVPPVEDADPVLEVSGVEEDRPGGAHGAAEYAGDVYDTSAYDPPAYHPQPVPDDTGEYGIYDRDDDRSVFVPAASHGVAGGEVPYGYGHGGEDPQQHPFAAYSDPYIGYDTGPYGAGYDSPADGYGTQQGHGTPDYGMQQGYGGQGGGYGDGGYGDGGYGADAYGDGGYGADAYGGAWVPQQRESDQQPVPEQSYPYQDPYGGGYGGGYGDEGLGAGYGYGYSYGEAGYPAENGYGQGHDAGQGYGAPAAGGQGDYHYDEQRGY